MAEREQPLVAGAHPGLGGRAQLGEALRGGAEPAGVEEPAQQPGASGVVGAQEAGEVALREQDDLAELLPVQPEELLDLLADLLVGTAEAVPLPVAELAQGAVRLLAGVAAAALLGARLLGPPGELQPAAGDGEFEDDLGEGVRRGVVAAQSGAAALAGAGDAVVEGVADGVEDGGLAGAGGAVQQEQSGGGEFVEVDALGAGERAERGDLQAVQSHRSPSAAGSPERTCRPVVTVPEWRGLIVLPRRR